MATSSSFGVSSIPNHKSNKGTHAREGTVRSAATVGASSLRAVTDSPTSEPSASAAPAPAR
jgi:hypothetical protein